MPRTRFYYQNLASISSLPCLEETAELNELSLPCVQIAHARSGGALARHTVGQRGSIVPRCWAETGLEVARRVELLAEMFAERRVGEANKLPLLLALEMIKAFLKIRMSAAGEDVEQKGRRTGMLRAASFRLSHRGQPRRFRWWLAGAILHSLRPVVYLAALILFGNKSWLPFLVSLILDLVAQEQPWTQVVFRTGLVLPRLISLTRPLHPEF